MPFTVTPMATWPFPSGSRAHSFVSCTVMVLKRATGTSLKLAVNTFAYEGQPVQCTDGGVSDPLPVEFARQPGLDATHVIISDCRQDATPVEQDERLVYLRPRLERTTTLRAPRATLLEAVAAGEATVTEPVATRIRNW